MKIWRSSIKVRSYELDSFGHVNNGSFINYLEKARGDYLKEMGMGFDDFHRLKRFPVIARISIDYKAPAYFAEELQIQAKVNRLGKSSITMDYEIKKADGTCCAIAQTVMVFVDESRKAVPMPEKMRIAFQE